MTSQVNNSEAVSFNPENLEDMYQLSPMQQGMLFHSIYAPGSALYVSQSLFDISGKLDGSAFDRSWQRVLQRHAILRTSFLWEELEAPVQVVQRRMSLPIEKHDWRALNAREQGKQLASYLAADGKHEFDLSRAPLLRLALFQLGDEAYKFLLSAHHILLDRWSRSVVQRELFAFYKAFSKGDELHLERPRPYGDYIAWLGQQDKKSAETYWRSQLKGISAPTSIGFDQQPADLAEENQHYDTERFQLSVQETDQLKGLARELKLTLNTFIRGVWALLLSRYSGTEDVLFGVTVLGRPPSLWGVESMVGLFINTLPLRVHVPPNSAVWPWLKHLQEQQLSLQQYEYSSLVDIQGWSEVPRGTPLFKSFVVFENIAVSNTFKTDNGGLKIEYELGMGSTGYPLAVFANPGPRLRIGLAYDLAHFQGEHVRQMVGHFRNLLRAIIADPMSKLSQLPLLTREEQQKILEEWNNTDTEYEKDSCIHQLFERQVSRTPNAVAIQSEDQQLTYVELNRRSNRLAHYLRKRGVGQEVRVAICVERSLGMMVGLLGILKAGAAYVPLDPAFPKERLAFMIADANVPVLLTQQHLRSALPSHQATVIALDSDWEMIARESAAEPTGWSTPEDLAYVIYTSGSTGKPKGVEISHRALTNFLCSVRQEPGLMAQDVMLSVTTLSFDIAALELYLPLITGARLVVVSRERAVDGNLLKEALVQSRPTVVQATPSTWKMLIDAGWTGNKQLKVLCGGDVLSRELANQLFELVGSLWNMYGPTETTIWSTTCKIESTSGPVSIGRPLANTQVYLLDVALNPVPVGIVGELHIGGAGLARGYLNRPELTAQKFIPHPFSNDPDERIYKTGDLARYLPDGTIECLGRNDNQVKIRGFRIELGEIESVLRQHPSVRESVVAAQQDISGQRQLVGYIVPLANEKIDQKSLRALLQGKLPDYMIPSLLVELATLPLTPNGKIDRRALPPPDRTRPPLRETLIAPRDDLERRLAQIWEKILRLESVGVRDNFFESGGHSLLAVRLVSEIEKEFSQRVPLVSLFQGATIEHLADILRQGVRSISWPFLVEIQTGGSKPPLICISAPNVNALGYRLLVHYLGSDQPAYGLQAQYLEDLQGEHSQKAVDELATEYLAAIRTIQPSGPYQFVGMCRGAHIAFEIARRLEQDSQKVNLVAILDTWVLENTYNRFLYIDYYARRLRSWLRLSRKDQLDLIKKKMRRGATNNHGEVTASSSGSSARRLVNPMSAYFPGPGFEPKTYGGRVSVFRTRTQPLNRIRDKELGWGKLAAGGVDLHYVPGKHGGSLLREPNVRDLAGKLRECLLDAVGSVIK